MQGCKIHDGVQNRRAGFRVLSFFFLLRQVTFKVCEVKCLKMFFRVQRIYQNYLEKPKLKIIQKQDGVQNTWQVQVSKHRFKGTMRECQTRKNPHL